MQRQQTVIIMAIVTVIRTVQVMNMALLIQIACVMVVSVVQTMIIVLMQTTVQYWTEWRAIVKTVLAMMQRVQLLLVMNLMCGMRTVLSVVNALT